MVRYCNDDIKAIRAAPSRFVKLAPPDLAIILGIRPHKVEITTSTMSMVIPGASGEEMTDWLEGTLGVKLYRLPSPDRRRRPFTHVRLIVTPNERLAFKLRWSV